MGEEKDDEIVGRTEREAVEVIKKTGKGTTSPRIDRRRRRSFLQMAIHSRVLMSN